MRRSSALPPYERDSSGHLDSGRLRRCGSINAGFAMNRWSGYPLYFLYLVLLVGNFIHSSSTLEVVPSSSCSSICLDDPQKSSSPGTFGYDIECKDSLYNTTTNGTRFQSCINCQLSSAAVDKATGQTNLGWALCECTRMRHLHWAWVLSVREKES